MGPDETEVFQALSVPPPRGEIPVLQVLGGSSAGLMHPLDRPETRIGRGSPCDIRLSDPGVSRSHARVISLGEGVFELHDTASTNGLVVGGNKVTRHRLQKGDQIALGPVALLKFDLADEETVALAARLYHGASKDPLTLALSRRQFSEQMQQELSLCRRLKSNFCLLLLDVDGLKKVNEIHGTAAGDSLLCGVAARIRGTLRPEDLLARYEGGLFGVLLRHLDIKAGLALAERIRQTVSQRAFGVKDGAEVEVTVALGAADLASCPDLTALQGAAERALRQAKAQGGNRVGRL